MGEAEAGLGIYDTMQHVSPGAAGDLHRTGRGHGGDVGLAGVGEERLEGLAEEVHAGVQTLALPSLVELVDQVRLHPQGQRLEGDPLGVLQVQRRKVRAVHVRVGEFYGTPEEAFEIAARVYLE